MEMLIRDYLLDRIIHHRGQEDQKLPSENEVAHQFRTTRNEVRKVYDALEAMGYLYSKQGVGRFLTEKKPEIELQLRGDQGFSEKMAEMKIPYHTINLGVNVAGDTKTLELHRAGLTGRIFEVSRLRMVYDKPCAIHRSYVSEDRFPTIEEDGHQITSIFTYYHEHGYHRFRTSGTSMSISFPTLAEMEVLQCGNLVPLVILESDCIDGESHSLLEVTSIIYRSDLFKYKINIR